MEYPKTVGQQKVWHHVLREEIKEEEIFETLMTESFHQIYVKHQTTGPGSSENIKKNKCQQTACRHIIFKPEKNQRWWENSEKQTCKQMLIAALLMIVETRSNQDPLQWVGRNQGGASKRGDVI